MTIAFEIFNKGIQNMFVVEVTFVTKSNETKTRRCIPLDYGPSTRAKDKSDKFHFIDLESSRGAHPLALLPEQILSIDLTNEHFDPSQFVTWTTNWSISRDWGNYS